MTALEILAVLSDDVVSTELPSGEKAAEEMRWVGSAKTTVHSSESMFQSFAVLSLDVVSTDVPSWEKTAVSTSLAWVLNVFKHLPVMAFHNTID